MRIRTGVKKDGEITAVHYQSWLDGGAYGLVRDRDDLAVLLHAGSDAHLHRVPAAVRVEDLLAVERDLHRAARAYR